MFEELQRKQVVSYLKESQCPTECCRSRHWEIDLSADQTSSTAAMGELCISVRSMDVSTHRNHRTV